MNKNFFVIISLLLFLSAGCGPAVTPTAAPQTPASVTFPLTLTDDLGRQVTIDSAPQRVVSLLPSNTEILFAIGAGELVVGVTSFCNYPPEATTRQQVGGITNKSLSIETIVALEPDLIFASGSQNEAIPILEQAGLTVIALHPDTFEDIYANIELAGKATNHLTEAVVLVNNLRQRVEAVKARVAAIPADQRPTVFYEVWDEPLMTAGPDTFIGQMIELAGGKSIFSDVQEDWPQVSAEVIVARNPDIILGPQDHEEALVPEKIAARPGWATIAAVQNERIYLLDSDMVSRAGPRIIDILEEIARVLYPEQF